MALLYLVTLLSPWECSVEAKLGRGAQACHVRLAGIESTCQRKHLPAKTAANKNSRRCSEPPTAILIG